ncbi:MAG: gamma-glutamyl-gamma-aminobutyrate hydrolase family protein [Alphaproteobacteria bacterium]|nr:gamma-glutamyl-gamma-aminobutyrate hydrolase family protein [Alphaproteobacteria bacterium]
MTASLMTKPLIGITLDKVNPDTQPEGKWYSNQLWYALRHAYCTAIHHAGGVPIALPYCGDDAAYYAQKLDGLLITGGGGDVDPALYGETIVHPTVKIKPQKTQFEWKMAQAMLAVDKPILGICGGMQFLNVLFGGTLIQHIPDAVPSNLGHSQTQERNQPQHTVALTPNTLLSRISGNQETIHVNSVHHQAIKVVSPSLVMNAIAPDGVIEGIEAPQHRFCLGVQWHPECYASETDYSIFKEFIKACGQ